ncbi:ABC transporter ATP-binding protein [Echinicola marina]|uniref:ABC transporter ATP-binding protein n=1 Tax=Echinicola rosea TaxID=1807691 RepID=A0ABQ1VC51_9BACT|nr:MULTISPECIES: ABC transporter ATP-binding protein [Echinicola]UCS93309.1 ABC transporter ATP-binding protein [Echinicola marina]GGF50455.1 ABC transporter ATP-binding protein [Echinicola rosea]
MISIEGLTKKYGKLSVLDHIDIKFEKGQCLALIGPNGSGKTTLIKILLGLVIPNSGRVLINGKNIHGQYRYREQIGYMPQINQFPEHMRVDQLFALVKSVRSGVKGYDEELYHDFGLEEMGKKRLGALSGGMRQKVSAALCFLFRPEILIMDEPTAGLDPLSNEILISKLKSSRREGKLILISSHILNDLDEITSDVLYLMDGRVRFYKSIEELKATTSEQRLNRIMACLLNPKEAYV